MPSREKQDLPLRLRPAKSGAVLVLALVLVMLMTLMGISVAVNTGAELSMSANSDNGRKAFIQADSALRLSVLIARILLFPSAGRLSDFLTATAGDLEIEVNAEEFDLALMRWEQQDYDFRQRYLKAGARSSGISMGSESGLPLIVFKQKDPANSSNSRVVATSAVSLDYAESELTGTSLSQTTYRDQSAGRRTVIIVTTDGRMPVGEDLASSEEGSFFDGTADVTHTMLTTAFQELR
jgi:hypothetical protein